MDSIVCAYDGSPCSQKAAELAAELAKKYSATLTLVFVVVPFNPPGDLPALAFVDWIEPLRKAGLDMLQTEAARLAKSHGVHPETAVLEGDAATELVRFASTLSTRFIVCGSHGYGAMKRLLLGSVAQKLVHLATTPVVIAR